MKLLAPTSSTRPHPEALGIVDLLLRQKSLQPHMASDNDVDTLANTCRTLRVHARATQPFASTRPTHALAAMLSAPGKKPLDFDDIFRAHNYKVLGPYAEILADSRDVIWLSEEWLLGPTQHPRPLKVDAARRRQCLAFLWAIKSGMPLADGFAAVDAARAMKTKKLMKALLLDGFAGVQFCVRLQVTVAMGQASGYAATASATAWKTGLFLGKAKALACGFMAAAGGVTTVAMAGTTLMLARIDFEDRQEDREEAYATVAKKDAIFCELLTGRRDYHRQAKC